MCACQAQCRGFEPHYPLQDECCIGLHGKCVRSNPDSRRFKPFNSTRKGLIKILSIIVVYIMRLSSNGKNTGRQPENASSILANRSRARYLNMVGGRGGGERW